MRSFHRIVACVVSVVSTALAAPPAETAREAHELLSKGEVEKAIARYEDARSADPESPEIAYNLGVAQFRLGKYTEAAALFKEAAAKAKSGLAAKAMFNQGTSIYADALHKMENKSPPQPALPGADEAAPPDPLDEAISAVEQSVTHFRDATAADPADSDSRANAERAWRLLKKLREEKEKQEKQQGDNKDQKKDHKQQNQEDNDQKPSDDQGSEDQRQPEDEKRNQSKSNEKQKDQGQESEPKDQKPGEEKGKPQPQQSSKGDGKPEPADAQQGVGEDQKKPTMTKQEAERLLQIVRDKEKERREQKARADRARQPPVSKDW